MVTYVRWLLLLDGINLLTLLPQLMLVFMLTQIAQELLV
jgi:hypothetical protein